MHRKEKKCTMVKNTDRRSRLQRRKEENRKRELQLCLMPSLLKATSANRKRIESWDETKHCQSVVLIQIN